MKVNEKFLKKYLNSVSPTGFEVFVIKSFINLNFINIILNLITLFNEKIPLNKWDFV